MTEFLFKLFCVQSKVSDATFQADKQLIPSTLVMTAVPAKVAGVPRIVVCSPSDAKGKVNPLVLVAADICGVNEVYKVGGAQAIAALAYGTKTIAPVRKIVVQAANM